MEMCACSVRAVLDLEPGLRLLAFERRPRGRLARLPVAAQLGDLAHDGLVGQPAGGADDDVRRRVVALHVRQHVVPRRPGDRLAGPGYLAAQGMIGPQQRVGEDVGAVAGVVLHHALLLVDDHALLLDVLRPVQGVAQHVDEQVDGLPGVGLRHLAPVGRELVLGGGVDLPADGLHGAADVLGVGPAARALEDEVLDEVGQPGAVIVLVAGADADEYAGGDRPGVGHRACDDAEAVVERGLLVGLACVVGVIGHRRDSRSARPAGQSSRASRGR